MLESILIGVVIALAAIILLIIIVGGVKSIKKNKKIEQVESSETQIEVKASEETKEEVKSMKIVIAQGESVVVGSEGRIPCGEYTMESCDGEEAFNVRIGRYVKEYKNGSVVVLTEKQKITPVSTSIILR